MYSSAQAELWHAPAAVFPAAASALNITADTTAEDSLLGVEGGTLPSGMVELMRSSRLKYLEGSSFIKAGDSDKARDSFNGAVDMLLQSNWNVASTPALNRFFQDLIQRIQADESRYLLAPCNTEDDQLETAVVDELSDIDLIPSKVDPSLESALTSDLPQGQYDIPITINDMVLKSLDFWLNSGRKFFVDGLLRSGQYRPMIEKVFREESIPLDLMYLAQVESLFKPHALSKAKAKGIWQFEKDTAIRYGLKVTKDVDERSDPEKSTRAAARYLSDLFAMFKDWNLALAAYNWGEARVQRLIETTGLKDFWQLVDLRRRLPEETKNHVPLIQASVILARNPEKYGLPTELDPPMKYTEVSVSKPIDLRAAAKVLSTSIDELKKLNPSLKGLTTPANYPNFQLKVPLDTDPLLHDQLAALPTAKPTVLPDYACRHKVKAGETLAKIASRYHVSVAALETANNLSSRKKLVPGTWIQVPNHALIQTSMVASKGAVSRSGTIKAAAKQGTIKNAAKDSTMKSAAPRGAIRTDGSKIKAPKPKSGWAKNRSSKPAGSLTAQSKTAKPRTSTASLKSQPGESGEPKQAASK
jgi:membrane-bound lytic murein transglycosylase D